MEGTAHLTAAVAGDGIDPQQNNNQARASTQVVKEWIVLDEDFTGAPGSHWSSSAATTSPSGERFMGEFGNETVNLRLENLPDHRRVRLEFDLYLIRSWDGNQAGPGPDRWRLCFTGGLCLIDTTFSNWQTEGFRQAYPEAYPGGDFLSLTGAQSVNSLGYTYYGIAMDSTYHIVLTFDHADPDLLLSFSAFGLQPSEDESWGLDNVKISLLPPTGDRRILLPLVMR
ncbi:MAG: hypothetical protein GX491_13215 [Chloroflexi bacterium]|nr:hypothetical protein [Chloroflexota bacterium]